MSTAAASASTLPWVEKYRPKTLDDVVGNREAVDRLRAIAKGGNMPNLILSGPPGCGKTTSVLCLARALLGASMTDNVLELNASDDRGIDVVRETIKQFAKKKTASNATHKIVILDEADSMTTAAQQALRRTMETFSKTTRFALACNFSSEVIEAVQSRCAIVRFSRVPDEEMLRRLRQVVEAERVQIDESGYSAVLFAAEGDMRHALNTIQAAAATNSVVTKEAVWAVADQPQPDLLRSALASCLEGLFDEAWRIIGALANQGHAPADIVSSMFKVLKVEKTLMSEGTKLEFMREIGLTHTTTGTDGVNTNLQLAALVSRLCLKSPKLIATGQVQQQSQPLN